MATPPRFLSRPRNANCYKNHQGKRVSFGFLAPRKANRPNAGFLRRRTRPQLRDDKPDRPHGAYAHEAHRQVHTDRVKARCASAFWLAPPAKDSSHYACAIAAPRLQPGPAPPFPRPGRPSARSIVGHKQSAPQTGWSETSGYGGARPPARTRAAAAPSQPPLLSPRPLFPSPPRPAAGQRERAIARPRPTAPYGRPCAAGRAPRSSPQAHGRRALSSSRLALSHLAATRVSGAAMRAQSQATHWPRRGGPR